MIASHVEELRRIVARRLGLNFDDSKLGQLGEVLERRASGRIETYLASIGSEELRVLAEELTICETYFFRNREQLDAFREVALPAAVARARDAHRTPRILSAACASGEEAYTLSIIARTAGVLDASILGVDVNPAMLARAERGRYTAWAVRDTSPDVIARWFKPEGRDWLVGSEVRAAVAFQERNLVDPTHDLWLPERFDVIFCRNVLMYMTPENMIAIVDRLTSALAPGGHLFLGHAETLRGLSHDFHLCHTHEAFYYQRKDQRTLPPPPPRAPIAAPEIETMDESWVDVVRSASRRIEALADRSRGAAPARGWDLGPVLDLIRVERFADALELVSALPAESARDPDVLLLRAVLLVHRARGADAEEACRQLLAIDELNAGAHYVLALCRELAGDHRAAADEDQTAAYLDPTFAMPRVHLGLLAARAKNGPDARRELEQAIRLLRTEDPSRLLLFGGGFGREALIAMCQRKIT